MSSETKSASELANWRPAKVRSSSKPQCHQLCSPGDKVPLALQGLCLAQRRGGATRKPVAAGPPAGATQHTITPHSEGPLMCGPRLKAMGPKSKDTIPAPPRGAHQLPQVCGDREEPGICQNQLRESLQQPFSPLFLIRNRRKPLICLSFP